MGAHLGFPSHGTPAQVNDESVLWPSVNGDRGPGLPVRARDPVGFADPSFEIYDDLSRAYRIFNQRMFGGQLRPCLITLRARGKVPGYFFPLRFVDRDGRRSHEIALNPKALGHDTMEQCLSSLAHEMVHQAQFDSGTASRRGYHNLDFARRMLEIGLPTSSSGAPGGDLVGDRMSHYTAPDGTFLVVVRELLDANFGARWADRFVPEMHAKWAEDGEPMDPYAPSTRPTLTNSQEKMVGGLNNPIPPGGEAQSMGKKLGRKDLSKSKFVCPCCQQAAWGKRSLDLVCGKCSEPMAAT